MMKAPKNVVISRRYEPAPDACVRALNILLKKSVRREGGPVLTTLNDTRGDPKHGSRAGVILHQES